MLIHENAQEVKQRKIQSEFTSELPSLCKITWVLKTFINIYIKNKIFFAICRVALLFVIISLKWVTNGLHI